jgi:hypothetical protein
MTFTGGHDGFCFSDAMGVGMVDGGSVVAKFLVCFRGLCVMCGRVQGDFRVSPRPFVSNRKSRSDRGERGGLYVFGGWLYL